MTANADAAYAAGMIKVTAGGVTKSVRGRIVPGADYSEDFSGFELAQKNHLGETVAFPPSPFLASS